MTSSAANHERGEGIEQMQVIFRPDRGHDPAIHEVIAAFASSRIGAGFIGYHRSGRLTGKLSQRIHEVGRVIYNSETMRQAIEKPEHFADSLPVPLETPAWQSLWHRPLGEPLDPLAESLA
jgi:hypothetical protein